MPRWPEAEDDWDEESDTDEEEFDAGDDDEPTVSCPYCRRDIHEDSPRCPHCGNYISEEDAPPSRKPWWIVVGVLVCLLLIYFWIVG